MRRRSTLLAAALGCALALSACGSFQNTIQPRASRTNGLSVELAGTPDAGQLGLLEANADGAMERAGVRLTLQAPASSANPIADLEAGRVDVAIVPEPALMLARSANEYVLGFGALTQRAEDGIVSLRSSRITGVAALRGRAVGIVGTPYARTMLSALLARDHVPARSVRIVAVGADLAGALRSHRVSATFGPLAATQLALRRAHRTTRALTLSALHVPAYGDLVFVTRETFFANNVNLLRRFVQAAGRGAATVRADPASGARMLQTSDPSLGAGLARALVQGALPGYFPSDGHPWGWQDQDDWNAFGRWMTDRRLISGPPAWYEASTNQLLAGQGP